MNNKALWDVSVQNNSVDVWRRGFFERKNHLSFVEWSDDDYIEIGNYRFHKSDINRPCVQKFLKRKNLV